MKNQFYKVLKVTFFVIFFILSKSYAIENVTEFTDAINNAREEFNNISEATTEQSKIIDEAIKEIDKATEYVQDAINNGNAEDAVKTLEFIEKSLSDVESIIPREFSSDMSNIDTSAISKEDMDAISEITTQMNVTKEKKDNEFMSDLIDLNLKGIDTVSISENLNGLGVETIELVLDVEGAENLENWTKEQWAESYTGDILTSVGDETITDKDINNKVVDLEQQLQTNNVTILDKRTSLTELQTKIDPLSNEITDLQSQKTNLLAKYNEEVLKQSSTVLSDEEIGQSRELSDQLNSQLGEISKDIKVAESQSNALQQQVQGLNLELTNEIGIKTQLENNIRNLNNQLSANQNLLSQKASELNNLKNTDLNLKAKDLNDSLDRVTLQRDFAQRDFNKAIDKEVDAFQRYYSALGEVDADNYDIQAEYAVREVRNILNPDPKQYRAFEYEKYSKLVGLPQNVIDEGLTAIANDDWGKQKEITKKIMKELEKNPQAVLPKNYYFEKVTDGEINTMIAEDKAIQEAVYTSIELNNIKEKVNSSIAEKTKDIQPLIGLNTTWIGLSSLQSNVAETNLVKGELDKILNNNSELKNLTAELEEKQKQLKEIQVFQQLKTQEINEAIKPLQSKLSNEYAKMNDLNAEYTKIYLEKSSYLNSIGGYVALNRDKGNSNYGDWVKNIKNFDQELGDITSKNRKLQTGVANVSSEIYKIQLDNRTSQTDINNWINLQQEVGSLALEQSRKVGDATKKARSNLIAQVEEAKIKYEQIVAEESKDLTEYRNKISSILKEIPTFENNADSLVDLNPVKLRAKLVDLASDGNFNESAAVEVALKELGEIGDAPVSEFMKGPYWEASNIKVAAIVRSKKYSYVDDYDYMNAYYKDALPLDATDRKTLEGELKDVLGGSNPVLDALNEKVESLSTEVNLTKEQSQNITTEMANLENELSSLKNSEGDLKNQINDLTNQFNSKESLISEKNQNLASIQEQLNPISERMNSLQGQRSELDGKLNEQLSTIANQVKDQGQVSDETNALKAQFESQIAELDNQIKEFENQSNEINSQLTTITTELSVLETENPEIANQIASLNQDLENFKEVKAELAMATAKKLGINVNEATLKSVKVIDGKVVIALEGTNLVSVVNKEMLVEDAFKFINPKTELSINTKVYTAGALNRELITPEFVQAAKSISASAKIDVIAQASAIEIAGATTEQSAKYASAKATRLAARKDWDAAMASGDKVAAEAAEAAFMSAKAVEQQTGLAAAAATAAASSAASAQAAAQEVASVAQEVASAANVQETVQDVTQSAQAAALDALWALEKMPGSTGTHTFEVTAAIRQLQSEMYGNAFNYAGASSYEEAMENIRNGVNPADHADPNRRGECGQPSC
jgi:uncharacterized coiled-coil DUF342 family protein